MDEDPLRKSNRSVMSRQQVLSNLREMIRRGAVNSSMPVLAETRLAILRILPAVIMSRSRDDLPTLERDLGEAHRMLAIRHKLGSTPDLKSEAWMLHFASRIAGAAAAFSPPAIANGADETKKSKILIALLESNDDCMTGSDLVGRVSATKETVSRCLKELRQNGFVESWKRGRARVNRLTDEGRQEAQRLRSLESGSEADGAEEAERVFELAQHAFGNGGVPPASGAGIPAVKRELELV